MCKTNFEKERREKKTLYVCVDYPEHLQWYIVGLVQIHRYLVHTMILNHIDKM